MNTKQGTYSILGHVQVPVTLSCDEVQTAPFPPQMTVEAQSSVEVSVQFKPSCLGLSEQKAAISFSSKQVGIYQTSTRQCCVL